MLFVIIIQSNNSLKICVVMMQVDRTNCLVSELADAVIQESAMFDEYESILGSISALQVRTSMLINGSKCSCYPVIYRYLCFLSIINAMIAYISPHLRCFGTFSTFL